MGIQITSKRVQLTDSSGTAKFDSNKQGFFITNYVTGTFNIPAKTAGQLLSSSQSTSTTVLSGGITNGADVVIGALKVTSQFGNNWLSIGGTTVVDWGQANIGATTTPPVYAASEDADDNYGDYAVALAVTFYVDGTQLKMDMDDFHPAMLSGSSDQSQYSHSAYSCQYFAFCGTFNLSGAASAQDKVFKADSAGNVAVWSGSGDEAPFNNPTAAVNLSRILFHSAQDNVGVVRTDTGSFQLSGLAKGTRYQVNLFAHGQGIRPLIGGYVTIAGNRVPIHGSFIIGGRVCSISTSSTHVVLTYWAVETITTTPTYNYVIYTLNYGVTGANTISRPDYYSGLQLTPTRARSGYFDTTGNSYMYKDNTSNWAIPTSRTIGFGVGRETNFPGGQESCPLGYRNSVNGHLVEYDLPAYALRGYPGTPNFNASTVKVAFE